MVAIVEEKIESSSLDSRATEPILGSSLTPRDLRELLKLIPHAGDEVGTIPVESPFTGEIFASTPRCTAATMAMAVRRAARAKEVWQERSFDERGKVFLRYHDLILDRQEEILDLIQLETGKARRHAFEEVLDVAMVCRYYALNAERHLGVKRRKGALPGLTSTKEFHHPFGVVGFIAPWNYPLSLSVTDAVAALMAGNGVVLKPDQQTPFTALWAVKLLQEAGLPLDLFQVVTGKGSELGTPMIDNVDFITFTGSTATGRIIARQAGERLIGCSLELGGKNSMIIMADADFDEAVEGALRGSFSNTGQLCISTERLYVHRDLYDRFVTRFAARAEEMTLGPGLNYDEDLGSLASRQQLEAVTAHVQDALAKGAKLLAGGRARPEIGPYFFEPTVLEKVTHQMDLCAEETFGPVVAVYPFDDVDEVIERANDTEYGLNASLWTGDTGKAEELAIRIETGTVNINEAYAAAWGSMDAPMGGFKASGLGRRHGAEGITKYTESQTVAVQRLVPIAAPEGVEEESYSRLMSNALWLLKRIPGIR
jgi:succinate-semialdehyde dehydrogenase/glutarate-semialdehyde dehydrogenase